MIITLCGSMTFYPQMLELQQELESSGRHQVLLPELKKEWPDCASGQAKRSSLREYIEHHGGMDQFCAHHPIWLEKREAIQAHFEKIARSDVVLVVNYPKHNISGYIGGNTLMEMGIAVWLNKHLYMLFAPDVQKHSYTEEILGVQPIILNGSVTVLAESRC